jgi:hypothetical protein
MAMTKEQASDLWQRIRDRLDRDLRADAWRQQIGELGQTRALDERKQGKQWSDHEVFEGFVKSVLSNSTDWSKIERIKAQLAEQFCGFDIHLFAKAANPETVSQCVEWFKSKRAGSMTLRKDLSRLVRCAEMLCQRSKKFGSLENYFQHLNTLCHSPEAVAVSIGDPRSADKLPGIGIPLAAEFLKNVGFDVCKPDRHINRAMGSFGLVRFRTWTHAGKFSAPTVSLEEMLKVMRQMKSLAMLIGTSTVEADNTIWLLCAKSGAHLSNPELKHFAAESDGQ